MLRDVFYFGNKPNAHPREKHALNLADARRQCSTEHFWIINEYCDYRKFDWDFDFEFLPDEDVWAEEHINIWPSQHQKDSGTWLCNTDNTLPLMIYRADVDPVYRRNEKNDVWVVLELIDETKFDFSWHPDPTDPPFIYKWGCKFFPTQIKSVLEYHVKNATNIKYMDEVIDLLPEFNCWKEHQAIDRTKFDLSWRPDPREPAYIYVWGNKYDTAEVKPTLEYTCAGATEYKYMSEIVDLKPEWDKWREIQLIDKSKFDFSWRPDPNLYEPPYIYVWGNKYISAELQPTLEYHVDGATERKYMSELVEVLPELNRWKEHQAIDRTKFDLAWRPDPREPAYIYVWGNKHIPGELQSTIEYRCYGATEKKYMDELVEVLPELEKWIEIQPIDRTKFDLSWRPDPTSPPYIYVWGNKYISAELQPTLEYHVEGATERKYMEELVEVLPEFNRWKEHQAIDRTKFDLSWRPDPREPAYIYVWGNKYDPAEVKPTLEYIFPGATEYKYMDIVELKPEWDRWREIQPVDKSKFDFSWRPDPNLHEPPYIYVWGNKHIPSELKSTIEYHVPGATEYKYMTEIVEVLPEFNQWIEIQAIDRTKFDLTWRPDPREPAYIYVWGNKHIAGELQSTIEYHCLGATEKKYMDELVEVLPQTERWKIIQEVTNFDLSWRPDPREPAYIYVWGNKHIAGELQSTIEYHMPGATEHKYVGEVDVVPEWNRYQILIPVDKDSFDFTWRPDPREPAYIYVWGNQSNTAEQEPTIEYHVDGATERKYITDSVAKTLPIEVNWKQLLPIELFDYSWRPDPNSPPYIYIFGNQWHDAMTEPTLEYHVDGAKDKKFVTDIVAYVTPTQEHWKTLIPIESFDYSWRPNPFSTPYIYVFGNQWNDAINEPTVEYHQPGAIDKKYITDIVAMVKSTATESYWKRLIPIESFDYSWRPDPNSPPYIYVFGNKWNDATTEPSVEYHVPSATEYKYINDPFAIPKSNIALWSINNNDDLETFDFSWRPNPHSPPQIYQWADNGPRYTTPGAFDVVFVEHTSEIRKKVINKYKIKTTLEDLILEHPEEVFWAINPDLSYEKFDFSWRPTEQNFRHINVFGNEYSKNTQTYYVNGPLYMMGQKEFNYVEDQKVDVDSNLSMFFVDKSNPESKYRFEQLQQRYPKIQKTRYLNSWVDTINRCINKSETELCWILNSELDYTDFAFDYYPSPWQMKMVHVFGTQWSHWGTTFMINKETFPEDTKHIKIIEHLSNLNFVKTKRAIARNCLYDVYLIDYDNNTTDNITPLLENKTKKNVEIIKYDTDYLTTLKNMLYELGIKKDHYIWVCSSICDYTNFDFTYICDPFANEQMHVFPSDLQKFGDTFFINVNKLRSLVEDLDKLENIEKINFNQHQRVNRLPAPNFITESDTHVSVTDIDFNWPYATFVTADNKEINITDHEPISLWSADTKNILITSTGGTRIVVPKEAKEYVKKELYDYPYIAKSTKLVKSKPLDIVFLSNGEIGADENYEHLMNVTKGLPNRVVRVDGIKGRVQAYHAAAEASNTPWMFTVFAKLRVNSKFDFTWQPDRLQIPKHYIFYASNPVNGLVYGHQAMIAYNKQITLGNIGKGLDFTLDSEHEVVELNSGVAKYNTDEFSTWRTSFREAIKLRSDDSSDSKQRLKTWSTVGVGDYAQYSINGALDAVEYFEQVNGELNKLRLSYDWPWLQEYFNTKYN